MPAAQTKLTPCGWWRWSWCSRWSSFCSRFGSVDPELALAAPRLFRVILPVSDIEAATAFYGTLLGIPGTRVSSGRHYFQCGGTILACYDALADGDPDRVGPNPEHVYFSVDDLEASRDRAREAGGRELSDIEVRPWGERSFYCVDPFGNPICLVDSQTLFTGGEA